MQRYRMQNPEVYYMTDPRVIWDGDDIAFLKEKAGGNPRARCRLCAHPGSEAPAHDMLIIHGRDAYVRPHRHLGRAESFQVIEGEATAVFFDTDGGVTGARRMTAPHNGGAFYYRVPESTFHMLIITSDWLVFHECTEGPFDPALSEFATWAPDGSDTAKTRAFMDQVHASVTASTMGTER